MKNTMRLCLSFVVNLAISGSLLAEAPYQLIGTTGQPAKAIFRDGTVFALGCAEIASIWVAGGAPYYMSVPPDYYNQFRTTADLPCTGAVLGVTPLDGGPGLIVVKHRDGQLYRHAIDNAEFYTALRAPILTLYNETIMALYPNRGVDLHTKQ
jgi:hypothetical protein